MHLDSWVSGALGASNWVNGRPPGSEKFTLGQELGVRNFRETLQALAPPPCTVAAARRELRLALICSQRKQCSAQKDLLLCLVTLLRPTLTY